MHMLFRVLLVSGWLAGVSSSLAYPTLASAYAAMGFDPNAPGNSTVVLMSDAHMVFDTNSTAFTTNLDARIVNAINSITPPPAKLLVSGDVSTTYSLTPGFVPGGDWYIYYGTNEMNCWLSAIQAITNIAQTNSCEIRLYSWRSRGHAGLISPVSCQGPVNCHKSRATAWPPSPRKPAWGVD